MHQYLAATAEVGAAAPSLSATAVALDVAKGMAYLHSLGHAHRDLKAANVLLDGASPPAAKVADFGLSRSLYAAGSLSRVGTPLWTAPELARHGGAHYTLSCDVYSYAIFLLELEAFALVHGRLVRSNRTCKHMLSGWRPPSTWLRGVPLLWLIQACWEQDEGRRPPFRQIVKLLGGEGSSSGSGSGGSGRCLSPDDVASPRCLSPGAGEGTEGDSTAAGGDVLPGFGAQSPLFGPTSWPSSDTVSPIASIDGAGGGGAGGASISAELAFSGTSA